MALPQINQQAQGNNVQAPKVPSAQQFAQVGTSQLPARPMQNMAPDNGQHGGAQRYMTPTSGAMNMANQRQANPYGPKANTYPGQSSPLPPVQGQLTPMQYEMPQNMQMNQGQYRQALQQRMLGVRNNPMPNMIAQQPVQQPQQPQMPIMFAPGGI